MGNTPNLARYVRKNKFDKVVKFLDEYGYRDDDDNKYDDRTAIEQATYFGFTHILDVLLDYKNEISKGAMDSIRNSPKSLWILIKHDYKLDDLYKYYMDEIDPNHFNGSDEKTCVFYMYHNVFRELVKIGPPSNKFADVDKLFFKGIILNIKELVACILNNFPHVFDSIVTHRNGLAPMDPIVFAASCNSDETLELLVNYGWKQQGHKPDQLFAVDEFGNSIFHHCAYNMAISTWNYLLKIIGYKEKELDINNKGESAEDILDEKIKHRDNEREIIRMIQDRYRRHSYSDDD